MTTKIKSIFTMCPGQSVNYPSRDFILHRVVTLQDDDFFRFVAKRYHGEKKLRWVNAFMEFEPGFVKDAGLDTAETGATEYFLDRLGKTLDHEVLKYESKLRMRLIKPGIRAKVNRHLRRRSERSISFITIY